MNNGTKVTLIVALLLVIVAVGFALIPGRDVTIEQVKKETEEAFETTRQYAEQRQKQYLEQVEQEVAALQREAEQLKQRASAEISDEMKGLLSELETQRQLALQGVSELRESSRDHWSETKEKLDRNLQALRTAYDRTLRKFPPVAVREGARSSTDPSAPERGDATADRKAAATG